VTNPGDPTCTLELAWDPGTSRCAGALAYDVHRSTTPGFAPAPENRIASGVSGAAYTDAAGLEFGATYHYAVRAFDTSNGVGEANAVRKSAVPTGPLTTTSWNDTFEGPFSGGGFDLAGWTHAPLAGTTSWAWSTTSTHDGAHSWYAQDVASVSSKVLVSPAFGVGPGTTLSFWHTYAFEGSTSTCYDGATLEVSTNGTTWTVVPDADFAAGGFTGTIHSGFSNPLAGKRAWCAGTIGALTQVTVNLGGNPNLLNRSIQVRWHEGDDSSIPASGWYVDSVVVGNAQVGEFCETGSGCEAPGAPALADAVSDCAGVSLAWTAGAGSTASYKVYRGDAPGGPYTLLAGMPVNGTAHSDGTGAEGATYYYVVTGACDASGGGESPYSNEIAAARPATGAACEDGDACTAGDTCEAGACVGGSPVICTALDSCHEAGACDGATGLCSNPARPDGSGCEDGDACTTGDSCQSGACLGGDPVPAPAAASGLAFDSAADLGWAAVEGAAGYDVVRGTLSALLGGSGFALATDACAGGHVVGTALTVSHVPAEGDADWFLIRAYNACGTGTYDDGEPSQAGPRDAAISASPNACP
jgi:hypothetical protein